MSYKPTIFQQSSSSSSSTSSGNVAETSSSSSGSSSSSASIENTSDIDNNLCVIPVASHGLAMTLLKNVGSKKAIFYYLIPDQDNHHYPLEVYLYNPEYKPTPIMACYYGKDRYSFEDKNYNFRTLIPDVNPLRFFVLKQDVIADYLNKNYLALAEGGKLLPLLPQEKFWESQIQCDVFCGKRKNPTPSKEDVSDVKVMSDRMFEGHLFSHAQQFLEYIAKLNAALSLSTPIKVIKEQYCVATQDTVVSFPYYRIVPACYTSLIKHINTKAVPSLKELAFRAINRVPNIFKLNTQQGRSAEGQLKQVIPTKFLFDFNAIKPEEIEKAYDTVVPSSLRSDPRFLFFAYSELSQNYYVSLQRTSLTKTTAANGRECNLQ